MAEDEARTSLLAAALDEEGHYFDFIAFYRKVEFCDRTLRLEILSEGKKELEASAVVKSMGPSAVVAPLADGSEEIPISSIVVAAKSRVLRTMLSNGMKESDVRTPVVLKVTEEEKSAFKEMLHFLYAGSLSPRFLDPATDVRELVGLLRLGDKFEVPSLIGVALKCLRQRALSIPDSVVLAYHIPESLLQLPPVKTMADDARARISKAFRDVSMKWGTETFLRLELEVVENLLRSEELEADSEEEILQKLLAWVRERYDSQEERTCAMSRLSPHIRFLCLKGEYLEELLSVLEMQQEAMQTLINDALRFRAYSEERRLEMQGEMTRERKGIRDVNVELVEKFVLDEEGTAKQSFAAIWFGGRKWRISLKRGVQGDSPIVGLFLCLDETVVKVSTMKDDPGLLTDKVRFGFYVRVWPEGYWKLLFEDTCTFGVRASRGKWNALGVPWNEARKSEKYAGSDGTLTVKVVARRCRD